MKTDYKVGDKVVVTSIPDVPKFIKYPEDLVGRVIQIRQINYPDNRKWGVYFENNFPGLDFCHIRPATLLEIELENL